MNLPRARWRLHALLFAAVTAGTLAPRAHAQAAGETVDSASMDSLGRLGEIASRLLAYDRVAWITSDLVMALPDSARVGLGAEWFCLPIDGRWHAVYGRYDQATDHFTSVLHFAPDSQGRFERTSPLDSTITLPLARALHASRSRLPREITDSRIRMNQYVGRSLTGQIEVWYIPAALPNGIIVYGGDVHFVLDSTGREIRTRVAAISTFRGLRPDSTVEARLAQEDRDLPTVGNLFALLAFEHQFKALRIVSARFITTVFRTAQGPALITALRPARSTPDSAGSGE